MSYIASRYRFLPSISTLAVTAYTSANFPAPRVFYVSLDLPVQIYIEDRIREMFRKETILTVRKHIELVSEKIALDFLKGFDFDISTFQQEEKKLKAAYQSNKSTREVPAQHA